MLFKTLVMGLTRKDCATPGLMSELGPFLDPGLPVYGKIGLLIPHQPSPGIVD